MTSKAGPSRRIAITGAAIASPAGYSLAENFAAIWQGDARFVEMPGLGSKASLVRYVGACADPDPKRLPDRKVQKILRRKDVISLLTILETARNAGVTKGTLDPDRTGMYVGASSTQIADLEPYFALVQQCVDVEKGTFDAARFGSEMMGTVNPLVVLQTLMNNSLCFGSMALDIRGVNANFMDFQSAGLRAVGEAFLSITTGRADAVLAGGVATAVERFQVKEGVDSGYLAMTRDHVGQLGGLVRPYDRDRIGTVLSEGSAYVMLEEEGLARKRGATILGFVDGFAHAGDGAINIMGAHESPGLARAAKTAMRQAGVEASDLGLIMGHGSGSIHGDRAEAGAFKGVLGAAAGNLPLVSIKGVLGDLCEAGGVAGLIVALESLKRREAPPTLNFSRGDTHSEGLGISAASQPVTRSKALVTARSFLGLSAALVVSVA